MKVLQNLHTHTEFCDGENTCREQVERAIELGFKSIGFSAHGYTPFTLEYCLKEPITLDYINEVNRLKEEYKGRIEVYLGIEYDLYSQGSLAPYDYVIGSVHYVKTEKGEYFPIDFKSEQTLKRCVDKLFDGDANKLAKRYFELVESLPDRLERIDVVGHFDLITKSNDFAKIIDTESEEYRRYALKAIEKLVKKVGVFEINTGAMSKGVKLSPYPDRWMLSKINRLGGKVIITSDCHKRENLNFAFDECVALAKECGFKEIYYFNGKEFVSNEI